jgi:hypothetical protein
VVVVENNEDKEKEEEEKIPSTPSNNSKLIMPRNNDARMEENNDNEDDELPLLTYIQQTYITKPPALVLSDNNLLTCLQHAFITNIPSPTSSNVTNIDKQITKPILTEKRRDEIRRKLFTHDVITMILLMIDGNRIQAEKFTLCKTKSVLDECSQVFKELVAKARLKDPTLWPFKNAKFR